MSFALDTFSFLVGFVTATVFWWLVGRMKPLWAEIRESWRQSREEAQLRRATGVEENYRRTTLRRAQGMHLAAPLFSLDEIVEKPRLLAPPEALHPAQVEVLKAQDIVLVTQVMSQLEVELAPPVCCALMCTCQIAPRFLPVAASIPLAR